MVEDCAQSHGNHWQGQTVGTFGDVGCFSFYPTKGCGAFGDAGCIVTNSDELAQKFRVYRNYGSEKRYHNQVVGTNSRLDELQAGLLRVKLTHLDDFNAERCAIAGTYNDKLKNPPCAAAQNPPPVRTAPGISMWCMCPMGATRWPLT